MAKRQPKQYLKIDKRDGQVSAPGGQLANYFLRDVPLWNPPAWQTAEMWRMFVVKQPVAVICRDTIANFLNSLDWTITARDSEQRDELRSKIKYYTKLLERGNAYYYDIDFSSHIEMAVKDLFDLPFGFASEIGRLDDEPKGKVVWIRPLDGGTLAPTLNFDFPIVQTAAGTALNPVYLPRDFVSRVYLSPRTELRREGWGFAPPERIWRAIEMLSAGDNYYAQLMLNTPEAGILDLGDMEKDSAEEWVRSLRDLLFGVNPLKVPVLYEHTTMAKWIPFGKPPSEIMYDTTTTKYAAIVAAGYGLTLSDIGFPSSSGSGDTLSGTIRMERVGKGSGKAIAKKKLEAYWNKILPDVIKFSWIDYDDERNVSKGRARLASAQASDILVRNKVFAPMELRQQMLADGLISVSVPEEIDINDTKLFPQPVSPFGAGGGSKTKTLGSPVPPSSGGQGETIPQQIVQRNMANAEVGVSKAIFSAAEVLGELLSNVKGKLSEQELDIWNQYIDDYLTGKSDIEEEGLRLVVDDVVKIMSVAICAQGWAEQISEEIAKRVVSDVCLYRNSIRENLVLEAEEVGEIPDDDDFTLDEEKLAEEVGVSFADCVARLCALHLKSKLSSDFGVDATETVSNNIRVSREVSTEVLRNLPSVMNVAYQSGIKFVEKEIGNHAND